MAAMPEFELTAEQRALRAEIKQFVDDEVRTLDFADWEWREDPNDRIPWDVVDRAAELGLKDLTVPEEYGGMDASPLTLCVAVEELAAGDLGIAVIFDQTWKIARVIDELAAPAVRDRFFRAFVDDPRHVLAITLTEPAHGTDSQIQYEGMQYDTHAERDGDEWVITGEKRYISNGADAKTYVVFAQTDPEAPAHLGSTAFLVPADSDGLTVTHVHEKISQRLVNNATLEFDDLRVPHEHVLGDPHRSRQQLGEAYNESDIDAAASVLGVGRAAYEAAFDYAHDRVQGGTEIIDHQVIGHDFADMATRLQAARALIWTAARAVETRGDDYELGHMAKVFAADVAVDVTERALAKYGGAGIMLDGLAQKYHRDALSFIHSNGTQESQRENIITKLRAQADGAGR